MTRVLQRILRRRGATSDEPQLQGPDSEQGAPDTTPLPEAEEPVDAAVEPEAQPSFRSRGRMRRRLRYLRRARELGFRDLGGLVFDLRRFERDRPDLVEAKIHALFEVDRELRALERALDDRREIHELREPGIASCPRCGALHGSEARFCPSCGLALRGPQPVAEVSEGLPVTLAPAARPQLPGPPADDVTRYHPVPARPGQAHDEPAPFGNEESGKASEPETQVLPPQGAADSDGEQREQPRRDDA
jgi:zinc-ribbon domain